MLLMKRGLCCIVAVRATVIIAVKLKQVCMQAYSSPLTLRWSRRSHSLALLNTRSTLTRFLKRFTNRLTPWMMKSRPTLSDLTLERFL
jgi:hypothetical protein